ncbi:flagellin [Agrobacterium rosae]|uniref:Flagellin n=1 Tax=Agrobacterium rosae TaxID=1972867 RepID=A0AAE5RUF6_9HYPH|nr:flagellin [Agrobacterium rosae]KAA3514048.1 hypothetical protein DXM21_04195 [Agrobacterium rosae]KAA3522715.1 hypothetical protein DXM25_04195 [Agrobacterium rosae]MCM2434023.1 hypothetical protein [Agrobacterium rosae]MDX8330418.1 flagellin [Agrobacterium rosae]MQB47378.1 hypothetical protein [Agrobacterium rosae]
MGAVTDGMAAVGSTQQQVDMQDEFNKVMMDNVSKGVGRLVDADMEEQSAKVTALQSQRQLAFQALSIANQTPNTVLGLFQ